MLNRTLCSLVVEMTLSVHSLSPPQISLPCLLATPSSWHSLSVASSYITYQRDVLRIRLCLQVGEPGNDASPTSGNP